MAAHAKNSDAKDKNSSDKSVVQLQSVAAPEHDDGAAVFALRERLGNRGFHAFLRGAAAPRDDPAPLQSPFSQPLQTAGATLVLQRECACGAEASSSTGECTECSKKKMVGLQTKLRVSEPGDAYEQEADRVAEQVLAKPAHPGVSSAPPRIQRFSGQSGGQAGAAPASVDRVLAGSGRPLEPALRQDMEQRFGHDFSRVRVHTGAAAEQSAREVDASAYTVGNDIVFGAGRFAPWTHEGRRLIAHELTHVVQQSAHADLREAAGKPVAVGRGASPWTVQRSFLGSLAGALFGGGFGAIVGGIFGPIGAVVGALVGGLAGLIEGASESADARKLTQEERTEAERVYGPSLNYDRVRVAVSRVMTFPSHARTPRETVYLPPNTIPDPDEMSDDLIGGTYFKLLIHELCHVWQTQHGIGVTHKLFSAIRGKYGYGGRKGLREAWAKGKHFLDFGLEQQGEICADYYERLRDGKDTSAYRPYIMELRQGGRRIAPQLVPSSGLGDFPMSGLQAKLEVSEPGDAYEQEADRVADQVMRMPEPQVEPQSRSAPALRLSRYAADTSVPRAAGLTLVRDALNSSGQPLDTATRAFMEPRFGRDFSKVRVHSDAAAQHSAQAVGAKAYNVGDDIVFGAGRFAPATGEGRRLLAHELAHVTQRSGRLQRDELKGAARLPVQPTEKDSSYYIYGQGGEMLHYYLREEIQWHNNGQWRSFDLVVYIDLEKRKKLSSSQIAQTSTEVLADGLGLPLKAGGSELTEYIATQIDEYGLMNAEHSFRIPVDRELVKRQFDEQAFDAYWADLVANYPEPLERAFLLLASTNIEIVKAPGKGGPKGSKWAKGAKKEIDRLLDEARKQTQRPKDLPERVVLWHNDKDDNWYLNVWTSLDPAGKEKRVKAIKLKEGEKPEDTLERVREASLEALQEAEDKERREVAKQLAPAWAIELERKLKQRLDALHAKEKSAKDFPDGMVLVPENNVHLQIWVQRGDQHVQRKTGTVPLVPAATVDQLVPYVRSLTKHLRQYENTPLDAELPPEDAEINLDPNLALEAFPSELYPLDMRGDNISVTGAKNQFRMQMDYEAVYGGRGSGGVQDLYIASKLYSQRIHFFWQVYPVPAGVPLAQGQKKAPESWDRKWQWLYDAFNPVDEHGRKTQRKVSVSGDPVTKTDSSDSSARVKLPSEPGDYIVRCVTGHAPIGDEKLKRMSSESYYPVRVLPIKEVATEAASLRTGAIAGAESELEGIEKLLAGGTLKENEKQALLARQKSRTAELERLRHKETQTLGQNTAEELAYANQTLERTQKLEALLPDVMARAKAEGKKPSELITDPDLATLYWLLLSGGKSPEAYEKELKAKIEQLQSVGKRAHEFSNELKASSRYQYSPEAAFASEVTGQVYPLVLMLGEAPDIVKAKIIAAKGVTGLGAALGVVYSLVDVTSKQTQKVYYGYSSKFGPEGHREAIDNAFEDFGEDATYGEGLVAVRIPPGAAGANDPNHPGTAVKTYRSKEGILQKVLWALGIIGAIAGVAALIATGVGAPVAAGILGAVAATAGAIAAIHNIGERESRHTLAFDAELVMDIISIVGVVPAFAGARVAMRTAAGLRVAVVTQRFLQIFSWGEMGATVLLVPTKLYQDVERIENDEELTDDQKKAMIAQARLGAVQSGVMMLGSAAAAHVGAQRQKGGGEIIDEHDPMLRRQIEALEMEGFGEYKSMQDNGWVDANGAWTAKGREMAGLKALAPGVEAPRAKPALKLEAPAIKPAVPAVEAPAVKPAAPAAETTQVKPAAPAAETTQVKPAAPAVETTPVKPAAADVETAPVKPAAADVETPAAKPGADEPVVKPVETAEVPAAKAKTKKAPAKKKQKAAATAEAETPPSKTAAPGAEEPVVKPADTPEVPAAKAGKGKARKPSAKQKKQKVSAEAEAAAKRDDLAMQAKARERLVELEEQRRNTQDELDGLHAEEARLTKEHNDAVNEQKQASDERRSAKSKEAYDEAVRKGREAMDRAEAASAAKDKVPSDDDLRAAKAKLDVQIEVESIKADPKSRAKLVCFAGETLVATPAGPRRIDALRVDDLVWAYEFSDPAPRAHRITQTHLNKARDFVEIEAGGTRIRSTRQHRFWVEDGLGWQTASALRPGMRVRSLDGRPLEVDAIRKYRVEPEPSYNLSVDGPATYFVGAGVLVHNEAVDLQLGDSFVIYRASNRKNPEFEGLWYIGQAGEFDAKGLPRGALKRTGEHQKFAKKKLAAHAAAAPGSDARLSPEDQEFYRFMSEAELEVIVTGIGTKAQADYLEQLNIEIERKISGAENVMNRREQITSEAHMKAVVEAIMNDPAVKAKGYCP